MRAELSLRHAARTWTVIRPARSLADIARLKPPLDQEEHLQRLGMVWTIAECGMNLTWCGAPQLIP